jgi:hypothetical protein
MDPEVMSMKAAEGGPASDEGYGVRIVSGLGEITSEVLRATFPGWRIARHPVGWWAMREGAERFDGPQSLIQHVHVAADLTGLAERLCLQEHLDGLSAEELAAVWREMMLSTAEIAG